MDILEIIDLVFWYPTPLLKFVLINVYSVLRDSDFEIPLGKLYLFGFHSADLVVFRTGSAPSPVRVVEKKTSECILFLQGSPYSC